MRVASPLLALSLVAGSLNAHAGTFVTLPTDIDPLSVLNGGLIQGTNNQNTDKLYIENTGATYLPGLDNTEPGPSEDGNGNVVATTINYRAFTGSTTTATGTLTLLDWRVTNDVPLLTGVPQASIYDFVYRDSADGKLVFGTRYLNRVENDQEVNFLYRYGFDDLSTAAAWTRLTDYDLRLYQTGLTDSTTNDLEVDYTEGVVRQKSDISVSEGNPWSGLFLVKTNATGFELGSAAIGYFQAGEEGQDQIGGAIAGFVPTPVPEPSTYAMLLAGLGLLVAWGRRLRTL